MPVPSNMKIRRSKLEDAKELAKLARTTIRTVNRRDHSNVIIDAWSKGNTAALYRTTQKDRIRFVTVENKRLTGFTDMLPDGELMSLYVHPDYLGTGLGKQLLAHIEKIAKAMGIKRIKCQSSVNAKEFYEKHGYKVTKPTWWTIEGVPPMRVYKMEKQL
jgi:putative acetyltransferase